MLQFNKLKHKYKMDDAAPKITSNTTERNEKTIGFTNDRRREDAHQRKRKGIA